MKYWLPIVSAAVAITAIVVLRDWMSAALLVTLGAADAILTLLGPRYFIDRRARKAAARKNGGGLP